MQPMDDVFIGAAEAVTQAVAEVITHLQPVGVEVLEEKKEGPVPGGSFWGIRWKGGRKIPPSPLWCHRKSSRYPSPKY